MSETDRLLFLADSNLAEFAREQARFLAPFHLEETETVLLASSGTRFPAGPSNCMMMLGEGAEDPAAALRRARKWFGARDRGFSVYVRAHRDEKLARACDQAGYPRLGDAPGMVLAGRVASRSTAASVEIRAVSDAETATAFVTVSAAAYGPAGRPGVR